MHFGGLSAYTSVMPKFLEQKLKAEYGKNSKIPYKVMNAEGLMHGSKITPKGERMEAKHERDSHMDKGHRQVQNRSTHGEKLRHG